MIVGAVPEVQGFVSDLFLNGFGGILGQHGMTDQKNNRHA
jgi:hypothetical protein